MKRRISKWWKMKMLGRFALLQLAAWTLLAVAGHCEESLESTEKPPLGAWKRPDGDPGHPTRALDSGLLPSSLSPPPAAEEDTGARRQPYLDPIERATLGRMTPEDRDELLGAARKRDEKMAGEEPPLITPFGTFGGSTAREGAAHGLAEAARFVRAPALKAVSLGVMRGISFGAGMPLEAGFSAYEIHHAEEERERRDRPLNEFNRASERLLDKYVGRSQGDE